MRRASRRARGSAISSSPIDPTRFRDEGAVESDVDALAARLRSCSSDRPRPARAGRRGSGARGARAPARKRHSALAQRDRGHAHRRPRLRRAVRPVSPSPAQARLRQRRGRRERARPATRSVPSTREGGTTSRRSCPPHGRLRGQDGALLPGAVRERGDRSAGDPGRRGPGTASDPRPRIGPQPARALPLRRPAGEERAHVLHDRNHRDAAAGTPRSPLAAGEHRIRREGARAGDRGDRRIVSAEGDVCGQRDLDDEGRDRLLRAEHLHARAAPQALCVGARADRARSPPSREPSAPTCSWGTEGGFSSSSAPSPHGAWRSTLRRW